MTELREPGMPGGRFGMVGEHPLMQALYESIVRFAQTSLPVIVTGETGTGKECVARALHDVSGWPGQFVAINVAALPDGLAECELFGSMRGAFTGATDRAGLIQKADRGTLVLDEAADLSHTIQVKLLRVLEDGRVRRVGGTDERPTRFRLVVTTQRDPGALCEEGHWRRDFYFRVSGAVLRVPPLAERASDIPLLAAHFANVQGAPLAEPVMAWLASRPWPGNVRELRYAVERAANDELLDLSPPVSESRPAGGVSCTSTEELRSIEAVVAAHIRVVLAACAGNKQRAAVILGLSPSQVYRRLQARPDAANSHRCETPSHGRETSGACDTRGRH